MGFVDLNYNFGFDWLIELSDNKLSVLKPITIEEIVIFMIKLLMELCTSRDQDLC